jgi:hypothetical protein
MIIFARQAVISVPTVVIKADRARNGGTICRGALWISSIPCARFTSAAVPGQVEIAQHAGNCFA